MNWRVRQLCATCRFLDRVRDKTDPAFWKCPNNGLLFATVVQNTPYGIDPRIDCCVGNDPPAPHTLNEFVFRDDPFPIFHEIDKKIEDLWLKHLRLGTASQLAEIGIKTEIVEPEDHGPALQGQRVYRAQRFMRF